MSPREQPATSVAKGTVPNDPVRGLSDARTAAGRPSHDWQGEGLPDEDAWLEAGRASHQKRWTARGR